MGKINTVDKIARSNVSVQSSHGTGGAGIAAQGQASAGRTIGKAVSDVLKYVGETQQYRDKMQGYNDYLDFESSANKAILKRKDEYQSQLNPDWQGYEKDIRTDIETLSLDFKDNDEFNKNYNNFLAKSSFKSTNYAHEQANFGAIKQIGRTSMATVNNLIYETDPTEQMNSITRQEEKIRESVGISITAQQAETLMQDLRSESAESILSGMIRNKDYQGGKLAVSKKGTMLQPIMDSLSPKSRANWFMKFERARQNDTAGIAATIMARRKNLNNAVQSGMTNINPNLENEYKQNINEMKSLLGTMEDINGRKFLDEQISDLETTHAMWGQLNASGNPGEWDRSIMDGKGMPKYTGTPIERRGKLDEFLRKVQEVKREFAKDPQLFRADRNDEYRRNLDLFESGEMAGTEKERFIAITAAKNEIDGTRGTYISNAKRDRLTSDLSKTKSFADIRAWHQNLMGTFLSPNGSDNVLQAVGQQLFETKKIPGTVEAMFYVSDNSSLESLYRAHSSAEAIKNKFGEKDNLEYLNMYSRIDKESKFIAGLPYDDVHFGRSMKDAVIDVAMTIELTSSQDREDIMDNAYNTIIKRNFEVADGGNSVITYPKGRGRLDAKSVTNFLNAFKKGSRTTSLIRGTIDGKITEDQFFEKFNEDHRWVLNKEMNGLKLIRVNESNGTRTAVNRVVIRHVPPLVEKRSVVEPYTVLFSDMAGETSTITRAGEVKREKELQEFRAKTAGSTARGRF